MALVEKAVSQWIEAAAAMRSSGRSRRSCQVWVDEADAMYKRYIAGAVASVGLQTFAGVAMIY